MARTYELFRKCLDRTTELLQKKNDPNSNRSETSEKDYFETDTFINYRFEDRFCTPPECLKLLSAVKIASRGV